MVPDQPLVALEILVDCRQNVGEVGRLLVKGAQHEAARHLRHLLGVDVPALCHYL